MMFKGLGSSTELDFAHVSSVECPVSAVMAKFFEADPKGYALFLFCAVSCQVTPLAAHMAFVK